jgi:CheY-like chemotaxis protein
MGSNPVVLLVDDEAAFVANLARLLTTRGFMVHTAGDGAEALTRLRKAQPRFDAVVLDVNMPVLNGIGTLKALKQLPPPHPEVIMLTGRAEVETGIQAIRSGAYDYLLKPCEADDLAAKIREACRGVALRRRPILWARRLAGEILREDVPPLYMDQPLAAALEALGPPGVGAGGDVVFVLDREEKLAGRVTRQDLVAAAVAEGAPAALTWDGLCGEPPLLPAWTLERCLQPGPEACGPEEPLRDLAERMLQAGTQALPVVEDGCYLGMVVLPDVLFHLAAGENGDEEANDHD